MMKFDREQPITRRHSDDAGGCAALTAVISAEYVGHASPAEEDLQKT